MRIKRIYILLLFVFNCFAAELSAQAPVAEPLPLGKDALLLKSKNQKLWCVQLWQAGALESTFLVSYKLENKWKSLPILKLKAGNKKIRINDVEVLGSRIYLGGDFNVPGTTRHGLIYFDLNTYTWKSDSELTLTGNTPVVNSLFNQNGIMYVGGSFNKSGIIECQNLLKIFQNGFSVRPMKFNGFNGANGTVNQIIPDSTGKNLYIAGAYSKILGSAAGGLATYSISDTSATAIAKTFRNPLQIGVSSRSIFVADEDDKEGNIKIYIFNGFQWTKPSNVDSVFAVTGILATKGETYICGDMKIGQMRKFTLFRLVGSNLEVPFERIHRIEYAEWFNNELHIACNIFNSLADPYTIARIAKDMVRVSGRLYLDRNSNGRFDLNDLRLPNRLIKVSPQSEYVLTDRLGFFSVLLQKKAGAVYLISPDNRLGEYGKVSTVRIPVDTLPAEPLDLAVSFRKTDYSDIQISVRSMQGNLASLDTAGVYSIFIENRGSKTESPDISLSYNNNLIKVRPDLGPNQIDPGKLTWKGLTIEPGEQKNITVRMIAPSTSFNLKQSFGIAAAVSGIADDNTANNTDSISQEIAGNIPDVAKFQNPGISAGDTIAWYNPALGRIDYTIKFTNNSTDTMNFTVIRDTVSAPNWVTYIQETGSSHPFSRMVYTNPALPQKVILVYTFNNLKLPPASAVSPESGGASGFISFRLGIANSIPTGTNITNRASVLMENSLETATNMVKARVAESVNIEHFTKTQGVIVYPNPNYGVLNFKGLNQPATLRLYNSQGQILLETPAVEKVSVNHLHIPNGLVFWSLQNKNGYFAKGNIIFVE